MISSLSTSPNYELCHIATWGNATTPVWHATLQIATQEQGRQYQDSKRQDARLHYPKKHPLVVLAFFFRLAVNTVFECFHVIPKVEVFIISTEDELEDQRMSTLVITGQPWAETQRYTDSTLSDGSLDEDASLENLESGSNRHPLGVKPSGNALTSRKSARDHMGKFAVLPDSLLLGFLEFLDQSSLISLGATCRAFYAYCSHDQLWRDIAIHDMHEDFSWRGSWRASLRQLPTAACAEVDCGNVFSDALHRPFLCSQIPLVPYVSTIPPRNQIPRLEDLSREEFHKSWGDRPFILTSPVKKWPIFGKWNLDTLLAKHGDTVFRCEAVDWKLKTYIDYMKTTRDESPLYLFDRSFAEKMELQDAYEAPTALQEDLFTLLGEHRPDHRWLIVGPERSASTFHKDPNSTSAWNAVLTGSKYWILMPRDVIPPGVYVSEDQSEVTSPLSIAEWLLSFHSEARATIGCVEGVCREGEVVHVPSSWWHCVLNLEPTIAITQNFVPKAHAKATLRFLRDKTDQISGFRDNVTDAYALFMERLRKEYPDLAASLNEPHKRKWNEVVNDQEDAEGERQGFSFGFSGDIDDE